MGFTTNFFLFVFLPIVLLCFYLMKDKCKKYFLLFISLVFYIWGSPKTIVILVLAALVDYILGRLLKCRKIWTKKLVVFLGVVGNIGLLAYFKYVNFFIETINKVTSTNLSLKEIIVPIGISYFTFSGISYLVDVYRGNIDPEPNVWNFLLYMCMFQKITAGPIVRYGTVSNQLKCIKVNTDQIVLGVQRFCIGLSKKVLIADQLGIIADEIFSVMPAQNLTSTAWLGMICYTLQIYYDFSGYSDMAIGLAKMCGIEFSENFNYPYTSKSMTEFWRRWHISLSTWFRDYLYIPLGGNRRGNLYFNSAVVFLATGLWHGASWHFVFWGLWHGAFLIAEKFMRKRSEFHVPDLVKHAYTLLAVSIGWVFFRCNSLTEGLQYVKRLFGFGAQPAGFTLQWYLSPKILLILIAAALLSTFISKKIYKRIKDSVWMNLICLLLLACSIICVMSSTYSSFIYFKF